MTNLEKRAGKFNAYKFSNVGYQDLSTKDLIDGKEAEAKMPADYIENLTLCESCKFVKEETTDSFTFKQICTKTHRNNYCTCVYYRCKKGLK